MMKCAITVLLIYQIIIAVVNVTPVVARQANEPALFINGKKFNENNGTLRLKAAEDATSVKLNILMNNMEDQAVEVSATDAKDEEGVSLKQCFLPDFKQAFTFSNNEKESVSIPISPNNSNKKRSTCRALSTIIRIYFKLTLRIGRFTFKIEACIQISKNRIWGDPHFTVPLPQGENLCYSIQGIPDLSFNLLSNKQLIINALFTHSINDPTQSTWIGKLAVILQHTNTPQVIIFDSVSQSVRIEGKGTFKPGFIQHIIINQTGGIAIKTTHGLINQIGNPIIKILITNPLATFHVTFYQNHLDIDWVMQSNETEYSYGLLGQFMVKGVEIDTTKQILIRPGFEPVPIKSSINWNSSDHCWVAKNVGNQGEGLIKGSIYDYIVDTVESTDVPSFEL